MGRFSLPHSETRLTKLARLKTLHWPRIQTWLRWGLRLCLVMLALLAVTYLLALQLFARMDEYRPLLEAQIARAVGAPVSIRRLEGEWSGLKPEIRLLDLHIHDPANPDVTWLAIPHIRVEPSLRQTLLSLSPRLSVRILGLSLTLEEAAPGQWRVQELSSLPASDPASRQKTLHWLLQQGEWQLAAAALRIRPYGKPALSLTGLEITNRNSRQAHRLRVQGQIDRIGVFSFMADMKARRVLEPSDWEGSSYLSLPQADWSPWIPTGLPDIDRVKAVAGLKLWTNWMNGAPSSGYARVHSSRISLNWRNVPLSLTEVSADISAQKRGQGWEVGLMPNSGQLNGQVFPLKTLIVRREVGERYTIAAQAVHLQNLSIVVQTLPLGEETQSKLRELQPQGYISSLMAVVDGPAGQRVLSTLKADIRQASWSATTHLPGATGVNAWVQWQNGKGEAGIRMEQGVLDLRQAFRQPTPVDSLNARFSIRKTADAWLVRSDRIQLRNPDAAGEALLSVWIPRQNPADARLQLLAGIHDGNVASVWRYVPWPSAGDDTLDWLQRALREGRLVQGDFLYEGPLIDRPGLPPSQMQMRFALEEATLAYAPGWPEIHKLKAEVTLNNRHLQVKASQGQIYESIARNITAVIPELMEPVLRIEADVDSTGEDIFRLFRESPLKDDAGRMASLMSVKGEIGGHLSMSMPLANTDNVKVAVEAELPGNPVILKEAEPFDLWLNGMVRYETGKGLTSRPLSGFFLGQPLTVQFHSVLDEGNVVAVQVQADGKLTPASLKPWMGALTGHMRGSTGFKAFLAIPVKDDPVHLALDANLAGWYMDLPQPFGKQAEAVPLHFEMEMGTSESLASLSIEKRLQSNFAVHGSRISRAMVQLGEGRLAELPPNGLWVRGNLDKLNLDDWMPWLRPRPGKREVEEAVFPELESFTMTIRDFTAGGYRLNQVRLGAEPDEAAEGRWRVQLESERIAGEARLSGTGTGPVALTLYRLILPLPEASGSTALISPHNDWELPPVNLDIRQLSYSDWPGLGNGALTAMIRPSVEGLRLDNLLLKHDALTLSGRLDWRYRQPRITTSFNGNIKTGDIAKLFSAFDYPPIVNSIKAESTFSLNWPGDPTALSIEHLEGEIEANLEKGRIMKLNRTVSLSRLFGVLDTENIKRRMQFDFSDITRKGMAFDHFRLSAILTNGTLLDDFAMDSPSMTVKGGGAVNLRSKVLDQRVQIAVPLASALPVAAALVAGPLVGGALVAAESVLDSSLRKMTALNYQITGDWNNPVIDRVKKPLIPWRLPGRTGKNRKAKP